MNFNCVAAALVLLTASFSMAMDNRDIGSEKGDFKIELRERTAEEMSGETDKSQKYILIIGEDEELDKEYLITIKRCTQDAIDSASNKAAVRTKILQLFDATEGTFADLQDTIQSMACTAFNAEREKKELGKTIKLTTPNFEGLNTFISEHLHNCIDSALNKSYWTKVEGGSGFKILNSYSVDTIKKYCPKEGS